MDIERHFLTENDCYLAGKTITPRGIVVHDTGCDQKRISVYTDSWDRGGVDKCVHAFIGERDDGTVGVVQTLPWDRHCWGCGSGVHGSYNSSRIQFEICEDGKDDKDYFIACYELALQLCAELCREYGFGTDDICCHSEAHEAGYASNHSDVTDWFPVFGKSMDEFRCDVGSVMRGTYVSEQSAPADPAPAAPAPAPELDGATKAAVEKLAGLGVIKSPEYWLDAGRVNGVKYLGELLQKAAAKITCAGVPDRDYDSGIEDLTAAGIISTPTYWMEHHGDVPYLDTLLCALGGSVVGAKARAAVEKLCERGYLNTPAYWYAHGADLKYLPELLESAAEKLTSEHDACAVDLETALTRLKAEGIVNTPDYWRQNAGRVQYLPELLKALGGK